MVIQERIGEKLNEEKMRLKMIGLKKKEERVEKIVERQVEVKRVENWRV